MDQKRKQIRFPIIDSHIHLYAESHLQDLAWAPSLPDGHVLKRQNSIDQYRTATAFQPNLAGFVFVETDRQSGLSPTEWTHPLEEIDFLRRIKTGNPKEGEGHKPDDKYLLLGVVAWAPLGASASDLQAYLRRAMTPDGPQPASGLICGFRYLLQDKPKGTSIKADFINGLLILEKTGARTFDLGVDFRQGGHWQLVEAVLMLEAFYARSTGQMKIVINHFCKPDLRLTNEEATNPHAGFASWSNSIRELSKFPTTYMKLSGLFSELPPQSPDSPASVTELLEQTRPWMDVVFENFGHEHGSQECTRIMFGSDWPVCNVGGPGTEASWQHWIEFVDAVLKDQKLSDEAQAMVWAGTAKSVYGLNLALADWRSA